MMDKIRKMLQSGDVANEDDSDYDGALSYAAEWHSLTHGVYDGMASVKMRPKELPENDDVEKEPHYYKAGYILGTIFQLIILAGTVKIGLPV